MVTDIEGFHIIHWHINILSIILIFHYYNSIFTFKVRTSHMLVETARMVLIQGQLITTLCYTFGHPEVYICAPLPVFHVNLS